jgi:lambda family phage portal protein
MPAKPRVRMKAEIVNSSTTPEPDYHSASQGRRFAGYGVSRNGPNATLNGSLSTLISRSRHAFRNSPMVKKAISSNATNTVGTGIIPRFRSSDEDFNEAMRKTFEVFSTQCDPEGVLSLYGNQALWNQSQRLSGEVFVRRRRRSLNSNLLIPLQVQTLESDFVPLTLNETRKNGNKIKSGIEFNSSGARVAYWMYKSHPGEYDQNVDLTNLIRVPAADIIHLFKPERPGQIRGEPEASTSLLKVKTYESYDDAELQRKESKAGYTGMIIRKEYDEDDFNYDPMSGKSLFDEDSEESAEIRPGTFISGLPGEDLKLFEGDNTGSGYKDYTREQKLMIAASFNIPYELMTGDWSGVNDRIFRAFIQEYRRGISMDQELLKFQALRKIKDWAIQAAILAGVVSPVNYAANFHDYHKVDWRPHAWKHIHPVQDIQAQVMAKDNNLNAGDDLVAESGKEAEEVDLKNVLAEVRRKNLREEYGLADAVMGDGGVIDNEDEDEDEDEPDKEENENK